MKRREARIVPSLRRRAGGHAPVAGRPAGAALAVAVSLAAALTAGCSGQSNSAAVNEAPASGQAAQTTGTEMPTEPVTASPTAPAMVGTGRTSKLGSVLTGMKGHTLYVFDLDKGTKSSCGGTCAAAWPPLTTKGMPKAGTGASGLKLGTTHRTDGKTQVTVNGHPVYYYSSDRRAGDVLGQGLNQFGAQWWALDSSGQKITSGGATSPSPSPSPTGTQSPTGSPSPTGAPSPTGTPTGY